MASGSSDRIRDSAPRAPRSAVRLLKVGAARRGGGAREAGGPAAALPYVVNGTVMRVDLARPLPPKSKQVLELGWSFPFGANSNRMGIEDIDGATIYEVAQWYPRMAVYDDVRGWNTEQYHGQGEFYLEYGSFDVSITVPADMLVAATGTLRNPDEVLTAAAARAAGACPDQRPDRRDPRPGRDRRSRLAPADAVSHADLAIHRRQRARLRLGRGDATSSGTPWA